MTPVRPPSTKMTKKPSTNSSGVSKRGRPSQSVAIQQKIWTPLGMAIIMLAAVKKLCAELRQAGREHVVDPQAEAEEAGRDQRQHQRRVAEDRPPRERRDDRRDDAERGQEDDVDLGVAEEPEQVLPQQRVAAFGRVEEVRADQPVDDQQGAGEHHRRHGEDDHERRDQHRPDEERHAVERHAGRALLEDRDDDLDRDGERRRPR